jgi:hypothetical protein
MADVAEDEVIVESEEEVLEEDQDESVQPDPESDSEIDPDEGEDGEDDVVVTIGDPEEDEEEDHKEAPAWVKKVRKANRKLESENRKLKRALQERSTENTPAIELGEKPTLKSVKYDDKKYEQELAAYYERKRKLEELEAQKAKQAEEIQRKWQERQQKYVATKSEYGFKDFEEVEELVSSTLDETQQGIIVQGSDDSALLVYALGKNPKKLEELSKVKDPVEFAVKIGKMESQLKVTSKKAPAPEKRVSGGKSSGLGGAKDSTLERLRAQAEKTGDYSKVIAYKRQRKETD